MIKIAAVVLAAGPATRFKSCKMLAALNNTPLIDFPIRAAMAVTQDIFVITGCWHDEIAAAVNLHQWPVTLLHDPDWEKGISSVIAHTTLQLESQYDALLFMLADQPAVSADTVALLWKVFSEHDSLDAVCCQYTDSVGVPAIASSSLFGRLKKLTGDAGAKHLLTEPGLIINTVAVDQCNIDIDTPEDLRGYEHYLNNMAPFW